MKLYKLKEVAEILNVSKDTLRNWDKNGKLKAKRYPSGYRYYTEEQIQKFLNEN